ncbi:MAG: L-2-amino-thiazoline-4-carboxylic acid hydrolase [Coriobacteriia bacterium]|nr:L-2-amino-thiazoline-4-carboxylic acid hydrolase [Coriobacteriia bacterium]
MRGRRELRGSAALRSARAETRAAFENRALFYRHLLQELGSEIGRERAAELMRRAIRRRGAEIGEKYRAAAAERDLDAVARIFCEESPCEGALFEPGVEEGPAEGRVVLRMTACPLVDAWRGSGLPPEEVDLLCDVAAAVDHGTFEEAGLRLTFLDRRGRRGSSRCLLELRLPGREGGEA